MKEKDETVTLVWVNSPVSTAISYLLKLSPSNESCSRDKRVEGNDGLMVDVSAKSKIQITGIFRISNAHGSHACTN